MSEWRPERLGNIASTNNNTYSKNENWTEFRYLDTANITDGVIDNIHVFSQFDELPSRARRKVLPGDVIYSTVRPIQKHYGYIRSPLPKMLVSTGFTTITCDPDYADGRFIYYFLAQAHITEKLQTIAEHNTSAYPSIKPSDLEALTLDLPPLPEQKAIAGLLGALDDKIDLNRRMNETLEAMARALFKDWFVDFGPVRAKMAGADPSPNTLPVGTTSPAAYSGVLSLKGEEMNKYTIIAPSPFKERAGERYLTPDLWSLFPDRLDDTTGLPVGWELGKFDQLVSAKQGKYLAKNQMNSYQSGEFPYPVWGGNDILGYSNKIAYDNPTVLMTCRGSNCGLIKMTEGPAWISNNSFACTPKAGSAFYLYIYFLMEEFLDCVSGSAQPQITYTSLKSKTMAFPFPVNLVEDFSARTEYLFKRILSNKVENQTLAQLRDSLLPRLMSGQLRLRDAEALVEEAVG